METSEEILKELEIDKHDLDNELASNQLRIHDKYSLMAIKAEEECDNIKDELRFLKADIELKIRKNPEKYIDKKIKPTESAIKATVLLRNSVKKKMKQYSDAVTHSKHMTHLKELAGIERNINLGKLSEIWVSGYYSASTHVEGKRVSNRVEKKQAREVKAEQNEMLKKKRRIRKRKK